MIMKLKILSERDNPIMERKELNVQIEHDKGPTPSKAQIQSLLAAELKKEIEHVDIRNIFSDYGKPFSSSKVFVWKEKKAPDFSKVKKVKKGEAPAAEAEKKEEKKEEKK